MTRAAWAAVSVLAVAACGPDETVSGFADPDRVYRLVSLNGADFPARATLLFPGEGRIAGAAPCNSFSAAQTAPYPWIEIGPIAASRRACPELEQERTYFDALGAATTAEISGPTLILSNDRGLVMTFQADN